MRSTYFVCQQIWTLGAVISNNVSDTVVCVVAAIAFFVLFYKEKL